MDIKKLMVQVVVAMILFVIVSLILEGSYTQDIIIEKSKTALLFGLAYGVFIWIRAKIRNNKD